MGPETATAVSATLQTLYATWVQKLQEPPVQGHSVQDQPAFQDAALQLPAEAPSADDTLQQPAACSKCSKADEELLAALLESDDLRAQLASHEQATTAEISQLTAKLQLTQQQHEACQAELQRATQGVGSARQEAEGAHGRALCSASSLCSLQEECKHLKLQLAAVQAQADQDARTQQMFTSSFQQLQGEAKVAKLHLDAARQDAAEQSEHAEQLQEQLSLAQLLAEQGQNQKANQKNSSEQRMHAQPLLHALDATRAEVRQLRQQLSEVRAAAETSQADHAAQMKGLKDQWQDAKTKAGALVTAPSMQNAPFYEDCMAAGHVNSSWPEEADALSLLQLLGQAQHQRGVAEVSLVAWKQGPKDFSETFASLLGTALWPSSSMAAGWWEKMRSDHRAAAVGSMLPACWAQSHQSDLSEMHNHQGVSDRIDNLQQERDLASEQLAVAQNEIHDLQLQLQQIRNAPPGLRESCGQKQMGSDGTTGTRSRYADADGLMEEVNSSLALKEDQLHQATQQLLQADHQLESVRRDLGQAQDQKQKAVEAADAAKAQLQSVLADLSAGQHETERVQAALKDIREQRTAQKAAYSRAQRHLEDLTTEAANVASATQQALERQHEQEQAMLASQQLAETAMHDSRAAQHEQGTSRRELQECHKQLEASLQNTQQQKEQADAASHHLCSLQEKIKQAEQQLAEASQLQKQACAAATAAQADADAAQSRADKQAAGFHKPKVQHDKACQTVQMEMLTVSQQTQDLRSPAAVQVIHEAGAEMQSDTGLSEPWQEQTQMHWPARSCQPKRNLRYQFDSVETLNNPEGRQSKEDTPDSCNPGLESSVRSNSFERHHPFLPESLPDNQAEVLTQVQESEAQPVLLKQDMRHSHAQTADDGQGRPSAQVKHEDQHAKSLRAGQRRRSSWSHDVCLVEAQAQRQTAEDHAAACQQELAETMARLLQIHKLHEQAETNCRKLRKVLDDEKQQSANHEKELQQELQLLLGEKQELQLSVSEAQAAYQEVHSWQEQLLQEVGRLHAALQELAREKHAWSAAVTDLETRATAAETQSSEAQRSIAQLQAKKGTALEKLSTAAVSLAAVKEDLNFTKQALAECQLRTAEATAVQSRTQQELAASHEHHASLRSRAESAEAACAVAELLHEDHLEQMQLLQAQLNRAEAGKAQADEQLSQQQQQSEREETHSKAALAAAQQEATQAEQAAAASGQSLKDDMRVLQAKNAELRQAIDQLTESEQSLQQQLAQARGRPGQHRIQASTPQASLLPQAQLLEVQHLAAQYQGWWQAAEEQLQRQQAELLALRSRTAARPLWEADPCSPDSSTDGSSRPMAAKHAQAVMSWDTQRAALRAEKCQLQAQLATLRRQIAERERT
ncbi:hypothetical protein WJX74_003710 [Apatococcus lobatus]|uniref:Uncharacterized protein n=1 Tax=Apatococcus lobatus TaxID=904363 RepID=A0AAW1RQI6_9CHLO